MGGSTEPETRKSGFAQTGEYDAYIARALATEGGHLSIGRGGATLHFERGRLSGCAENVVKAAAIAAGPARPATKPSPSLFSNASRCSTPRNAKACRRIWSRSRRQSPKG